MNEGDVRDSSDGEGFHDGSDCGEGDGADSEDGVMVQTVKMV